MSKTITITDVQVNHIEANRRNTPQGVVIDMRADYVYVNSGGTLLVNMPQRQWYKAVPQAVEDDIVAFIVNTVKPYILDKEGI